MSEIDEERDEITRAINEEIVPYVSSHGGRIDFIDFIDGVVRIKLDGACKGCSAQSVTVKAGVERMLRRRFEYVRSVELRS